MMTSRIHLGYEVPSGEPVSIPLRHIVVTGLTQQSGKTTTCEAIVSRLPEGFKALVFRTKRGDLAFQGARDAPPFYRQESGWEYVLSVLEAATKQKLRLERSFIINASRGTSTLRQVYENIVKSKALARRGFDESVLTVLEAYFEKVLPQIEAGGFAETLALAPGPNVMDLEKFSEEVQALVISSCLEELWKHAENTFIIVPEAWAFIPQSRGNPVKWAAQHVIRQGAAVGVHLVLDSIPGNEAILMRSSAGVRATAIEAMWDLQGGASQTAKGEDIKDLTEDVFVPWSNGGGLQWVRVRRVIRHLYDGEVLRINAKSGVIDLTANHPIMKIPCYLVNAGTLQVDDRLAMRRGFAKLHPLPDKTFFFGSSEIAWLYGFFCAEGWTNGSHVCFSNSNHSLLERAQRIIREQFHLSASFSTPRQGVETLDANSPHLAEHMERCYWSNGHSSRTKMVPTEVMTGPKEVRGAFLEGYIAGDGSKRNGAIGLCSVSRPLLLGVLWLLDYDRTNPHNFTVHIRADKPDVVQISVNAGNTHLGKTPHDTIKKIQAYHYDGFLYDLEVESEDHTFNLGIGNARVHNSQDITGIDKAILKSVDCWLLGRQREVNEVKRVLDQLPPSSRPKAEEVTQLGIGQFFVSAEDWCRKVYVQPAWRKAEFAQTVATGTVTEEMKKMPGFYPPESVQQLAAAQGVGPATAETLRQMAKVGQDIPGELPAGEIPFLDARGPAEGEGVGRASLPVIRAKPRIESKTLQLEGVSLLEYEGLKVQLSKARLDLAKAEAERDRALTLVDKLQAQLDDTVVKLNQEIEYTVKLSASLRPLQVLRDALLNVLPFTEGGAPALSAEKLDYDHLANLVAQRIGHPGAVTVAPLEALRHRYQEEAVFRLRQDIKELNLQPRRILEWLVAVGGWHPMNKICQGLGIPPGGSSSRAGFSVDALVKEGWMAKGSNGLKATVREKVAEALAPYTSNEEEIELVQNHLVERLTKQEQPNA